MKIIKNFSSGELECQCGCGLLQFAPGFLEDLQALRDEVNQPMILNSACRCKSHNDKPRWFGGVGGHPKSLHVGDKPARDTGGCCAVDVRAIQGEDDEFRARLERVAWKMGWSVGVHPRFIHLDRRTKYAGLPQARFTY